MSFSVTQVGIPDNAITLSKLPDGVLTANAAGRAKMADEFVNSPKIAPNAVVSDDLAVSTVQYAEVEISSAEILALFTTPKVLVATPGAGKVLEFISLLLAYDYNTTAYTIGAATDLQVKYTDAAGAAVSTTGSVTGFLDGLADDLRAFDKLEATVTPVVDAPLVLTLAGANPTLGDSPIHAKVAYRVHATGL
jgi:hypothetical protein